MNTIVTRKLNLSNVWITTLDSIKTTMKINDWIKKHPLFVYESIRKGELQLTKHAHHNLMDTIKNNYPLTYDEHKQRKRKYYGVHSRKNLRYIGKRDK